MKVIYQKPIMLRIQTAVYEADVAGKRIERIDVTIAEANELSEEIQRSWWVQDNTSFRRYTSSDAGTVVGWYFGAKICVEPT